MTEEKQDPELWEDDEHALGDEDAYDGEAVEYIKFDPSQFEPEEISDGSDDID